MTVARWVTGHVYSAGDLVLPTVDNGHVYYASVAGTSGGTEPTFANRYPGVLDGSTLTWVPYTAITPATLRTMMGWDTNTSTQVQPNHTDTVLGNYLLDAIDELEKTTRRFFIDRPGKTMIYTSMLRATIPIPGLRTASTVIYGGTTLTSDAYWLLPDAQQTGVYTSAQFRAFRVSDDGPWWLADSLWFDKALDSPFYPGNYGGGYVFTSMPNDTTFIGDWGYEPGTEPGGFLHALGVLAGFMAMRPTALLADSVITPQGGVMSFASMPPEVNQFVRDWSAGQQVVSLG
jgi:hypothetical protein